MSFARWSESSDVYIFEHINILGITCFGCLLMPSSYDENHDLDEFENYNTRSLVRMLEHLEIHRKAGHKIPSDLEDKLKERWPSYNDREIEVVHLPDDIPAEAELVRPPDRQPARPSEARIRQVKERLRSSPFVTDED